MWVVGAVGVGVAWWMFRRPYPTTALTSGNYLVAMLITPWCDELPAGACRAGAEAALQRLDSVTCPTVEEALATAETWSSSIRNESSFVVVLGPDNAVVAVWNSAGNKMEGLDEAMGHLEQALNMRLTREAIVAVPLAVSEPLPEGIGLSS
jgi:hypothetical protein